LLEAVALLSREFPIALTIVGAGKSEGTLRDQARRLGIDEFARFTGFVGSPSAYIAEAHLFVLSTDYEGFGNVIVESLACGVPVVASDVPYGPRFVLGTEDYGILVRPNSISELAEGIRRALTRFPFSTALRAAARRRAEDFALDQVVERFEQLVDEIIGGHRRKRSLSEWP
jgi:glycosyltransferase involved in cell wall biosynthesis